MNVKFIIVFCVLLLIFGVEAKKTGRSRSSGSGRGSSKKSNPQPAPTSFSYPQPAPKPSFNGWQERTVPKSNPSNSQSHSYPSSGTGLSGTKARQPTNQGSIQRSSASNNLASQQGPTNNQPSGHSYPSSTGLSGSSGNGYPQQSSGKYPQQQNTGLSSNTGGQASYPQSSGSSLSGSGQPGNSYSQQHSQTGNGYTQMGSPQNGHPQAPPPYSGYRPGNANPPYNGQNNYNYHPQGPPPPYTNVGSNYGGFGHGSYNPGYGSQMPGYFGNYGKGYGGVSRSGSALKGIGIAGAGIGTVLTGLALWNLARSTGNTHHTVVYDNRGQPVAVAPGNDTAPAVDSILGDLSNCSLTISNDDKTEVLAIPCAIATSFTPDADVKQSGIKENTNDNTKCTVTVLTKAGKEYMTTIPCSILLNTAAENNVTEPPIIENNQQGDINNNTNDTNNFKDGSVNSTTPNEPTALKLTGVEGDEHNKTYMNLNCTILPDEVRDPINPCYTVNHDLTVIPLSTTIAPN